MHQRVPYFRHESSIVTKKKKRKKLEGRNSQALHVHECIECVLSHERCVIQWLLSVDVALFAGMEHAGIRPTHVLRACVRPYLCFASFIFFFLFFGRGDVWRVHAFSLEMATKFV